MKITTSWSRSSTPYGSGLPTRPRKAPSCGWPPSVRSPTASATGRPNSRTTRKATRWFGGLRGYTSIGRGQTMQCSAAPVCPSELSNNRRRWQYTYGRLLGNSRHCWLLLESWQVQTMHNLGPLFVITSKLLTDPRSSWPEQNFFKYSFWVHSSLLYYRQQLRLF